MGITILKPCPFCGSSARSFDKICGSEEKMVTCPNEECDMSTKMTVPEWEHRWYPTCAYCGKFAADHDSALCERKALTFPSMSMENWMYEQVGRLLTTIKTRGFCVFKYNGNPKNIDVVNEFEKRGYKVRYSRENECWTITGIKGEKNEQETVS